MKLTVSPNLQTIVFAGITIAGAVATGVAHFTPDMFPSYVSATVGSDIIKTAGIVGALVGVVGTAMSSLSSSATGIVAKMLYKHDA